MRISTSRAPKAPATHAVLRMLPHLHTSCESQYPPPPTLHSRTSASQLCTVEHLTSLHANLGYSTHCQMCANFSLEFLKLCEGQLAPQPSTHANFSQCSPHLRLRMRMSRFWQAPCRAYATSNITCLYLCDCQRTSAYKCSGCILP